MVVRLRWRPVVTASSKAPAMPFSPNSVMAVIISCRCMETSQAVIAVAVGAGRMAQRQVLGGDNG